MSFAARLTRHPIAFDPDRGQEMNTAFADLSPELRGLLAGTAGCSPYLAGLMGREGAWLRNALSGTPEAAFDGLLDDIRGLSLETLKPGLREAKRRAALLIALADLGGVWPLETVTRALSDLADTSVHTCLVRMCAAAIRRNKLPGLGEEDAETAGGMVVLSMGKGGAYELNYSSDIDLICLFDQDRYSADDFLEARAGLVKITRQMTAAMSDITGDGYVFRTDLRLRPDASVTPVCVAMEAAERYYESLGRTWERAAYIKARPAAGDLQAGARFLQHMTPFIWRKHLDFAAIQDAHDMRLKIRDHKGLHGKLCLEGHNIKLGRGGIREIEFFTQTRQLIAGGRDSDLRVRGTVDGLAALADKRWIPQDVAARLADHYRAHREVEHRLQMIADAQTHALPANADGFDRLARFMGQGDTQAFRDGLSERLEEVQSLAEGFFTAGSGEVAPQPAPDWAEAIMERWPSYPALRSERAVSLFSRLRPELLARMEKTGRPEEALRAFDGFLKGLPAGVQLFSLFTSNPQLIDLIVDISAVAPELAVYLSRNAQVLDAVLGGQFFTDWPGSAALRDGLAEQLDEVDDYERQLDTARRWNKEWHFRIGVHLLRGLIGPDEASAQYADLAGAAVAALWPCVVRNFAAAHGDPPGVGAVVLGMGSLGAARLGPRSDLDLIVIYDDDGVDSSDGRRPLAARTYYARLTKALVTALTAPMAEGKLYEVDMRLRPSGNQGPVATAFSSFKRYQMEDAWTWEHLALTRARAIAGAAELKGAFEVFRRKLLAEKAALPVIVDGVVDMRARLAEAKPARGVWDGKLGPGRGQDIELLASAAALASGSPATRTSAQLRAGVRLGWLTEDEGQVLGQAYALFRRVEVSAKLLSDGPVQTETLSAGGLAFFLSATGAETPEALAAQVSETADAAARAVDAVLERRKIDDQTRA